MGNVVGADKIGWVHIVDRRLLVGRNRSAERFYLPGGGREPGETDVETLLRETAEELRVRLDPGTARHVGTYLARRDNSSDELIFIAYSAEHEGKPTVAMEVAELTWVTSTDGDLVTDAERQLMAALVADDLID